MTNEPKFKVGQRVFLTDGHSAAWLVSWEPQYMREALVACFSVVHEVRFNDGNTQNVDQRVGPGIYYHIKSKGHGENVAECREERLLSVSSALKFISKLKEPNRTAATNALYELIDSWTAV